MCQRLQCSFPNLLPVDQEETIKRFILKLQDLDWFSLSLPLPPPLNGLRSENLTHFQQNIKEKLDGDCSAWYRAALMYRSRLSVKQNHGLKT